MGSKRDSPILLWSLVCYNLKIMFFIIAGVQQKIVELEDQPRMCPTCGLYQVGLKRVDHYLAVFFIPVIRVKKGTPFLQCRRCGNTQSESGETLFSDRKSHPNNTCTNCRKPIERGYRFCPYCGMKV